MLLHISTRVVRAALVAVLVVSALGLASCGSTSGAEEDANVEAGQEEKAGPAYDGHYDAEFHGDLESYDGQLVTLSAHVAEVVSDYAFSIADKDVEPLLVVNGNEMNDLARGSKLKVTGTVHAAFDLPTVEDQVGVDLDGAAFEKWEQGPYLEAVRIDTSPVTE